VPAPKQRREPLPIAISVKHHLPLSAEGTSTDLTVAEVEAATRAAESEQRMLDYLSSRAEDHLPARSERSGRNAREDQGDRGDRRSRNNQKDQQSDRRTSSGNRRDRGFVDRNSERIVDQIDLGVEARFVRVPNAVADMLARQLAPAEEKIFDQIWRLTVGFNRDVWRGKIADLMLRTGYSSRATVTKAIAGLSALGLIAVEGRDTNPRGRSYRIADRAQLLDQSNRTPELNHSIKKAMTSHAKSSRLVERRAIDLASDLRESRTRTPEVKQTSRAFKNSIERNDDNSGLKPSSSSREDDDEESQVRLIYQDLTSNSWAKADDTAYHEIADIPLPFVILGICYSVTRAVGHRVGSFKYCLPSIKEHHELMRGFAHKDLLEIAYRHLVRVKEAQRSGKWAGI
jgi:hypothetical protein